jgi:hypothetical protein
MPVKLLKGEPITTYACPVCEFPLNFHFGNLDSNREKIGVRVACSRCCWAEFWGEFTPGKTEENNCVRLARSEQPDAA